MITNLIKIADKLDSMGLFKEADQLDSIIRKLAGDLDVYDHKIKAGETFSELVKTYGSDQKTYEEQVALNKKKYMEVYKTEFSPDKLEVGKFVYIYVPPEAEGLYRTEEVK